MAETSKGAQTRDTILEAAHDLFVEQGYHGTSMRQIAERADIALGGIYNHFEGKEALFEDAIMKYHPYHEVLAALGAARGGTVEELVRNAASIVIETLGRREDFLNLMFIEIVEFESAHIVQIYRTIYPQITAFVQRLVERRDELRPIPLTVMLRVFLGLFISYFITEILLANEAFPEFRANALEHFVDIFLHGVLVNDSAS